MSRAMPSRLGLLLLGVAALAIVASALNYLVVPPEAYAFQEQVEVYRARRVWLLTHVACGILALAAGTTQMTALRFRLPGILHRVTGVIYALSVVGAGLAALPLASVASGGVGNTAAFGLLAVLWILTTVQAMRSIRRGEVASHRLWMARSFALTLAAVSLRAEVGLLQLLGFSFADAYQVASWTCWVLNLLVVEWRRSAAATSEPGQTAA